MAYNEPLRKEIKMIFGFDKEDVKLIFVLGGALGAAAYGIDLTIRYFMKRAKDRQEALKIAECTMKAADKVLERIEAGSLKDDDPKELLDEFAKEFEFQKLTEMYKLT